MRNNNVYITGIGIVSALGASAETHLNAILNKRCGLSSYTFFDGNFKEDFCCGMVSKNILPFSIDESPFNRANLLCEIAIKEAINCSCLNNDIINADLLIGTTAGNFHGATLFYKQKKSGKNPDYNLVSNFIPSSIADFIAKKYHLKGKRYTISSACASSMNAICTGFSLIKNNKSSMIIAGGVEALCPFLLAGFNSLRLLSKNFAKPFDASRNGFNLGEGAGFIVMENEESIAKRKIIPIAKILSYGKALEAYHHTRANPDGSGMASAINNALSTAKINYTQIDHIHLHGTATVINDLSEYNALKTVFNDYLSNIPLCSTKPMTGHTLGAAGVISCILSVLSIKNNIIPATLFFENPDPSFKDINICKEPQTRKINKIIVNSLGFGGEVASIILERIN
jgi:3-oxoacyl-[acyl-carrier-protein] synthase-1